jgi:hypothetical protein
VSGTKNKGATTWRPQQKQYNGVGIHMCEEDYETSEQPGQAGLSWEPVRH